MPWAFKDRVDGNGQNVIRPWLDGLPLKARLKIDWILRHLRAGAVLDRKYVKKIGGYDGLFEICLEINKVQYRPLGGYGPHAGEFTIVLGAFERNDNIRPPDAFATAAGHVAAVKAGTCRVCDHEYENPSPTTT
jgi:hypothetical protein